MSLSVSVLIGIVLSSLIGLVAYRRGSLAPGGVVGAILTGTLIFGFGGFIAGLLLVAFFVSSSVLSQYQKRAKAKFSGTFEKGSQRDFGQAMANGGWAALIALSFPLVPDSHTATLLFAGFVGAIATVTADTWATELGVLSKTAPRLLTRGRSVPTGTSGGITQLGTIAALLGSLFIGILALIGAAIVAFASQFAALSLDTRATNLLTVPSAVGILLLATVSGICGALFDSLLGATLQGIYFCEYDEVQTEKRIHSCGRPTRLVHGWSWLDNDVVNFFASVVGSLVAFLLASILFANTVR